MTHTITLTTDDHIAFQLYNASTDPLKRKKRRNSYFSLIIVSICLMVISLVNERLFLFYYFLGITLIEICFGNIYLGWRHKRHYTKHVLNAYSGIANDMVSIEIGTDKIYLSDKTGDSNLNIAEIVKVSEIANQFFIKISTGPTLIIPKTDSVLNAKITQMVKNHGILHVITLDWKWR